MSKVERAIDSSFRNFAQYNNLYYTPRQLYYEVCRALQTPRGLEIKTAAAIFGAATLPAIALAANRKFRIAAGLMTINALATGGLAWLANTPHVLIPPISVAEFENEVDSYLQKKPRPTGLLETSEKQHLPIRRAEDLTLYGLPRLLICQSSKIAEMLRANWFHLDASCAVLSLGEAAPLPDVFLKMLSQAENPRVFFLHDASAAAYSLLPDLRGKLELPKSIALTILGLRPVHALRMHLFARRGTKFQPDDSTAAILTEAEQQWLQAGWRAEVAAVHPISLLRVLRRLVLGLPNPADKVKLNLPKRATGFMS